MPKRVRKSDYFEIRNPNSSTKSIRNGEGKRGNNSNSNSSRNSTGVRTGDNKGESKTRTKSVINESADYNASENTSKNRNNNRIDGSSSSSSSNNDNAQSFSSVVIMDKINKELLRQILQRPDIKSSDISKSLQVPLSTIQRRRSLLERSSLVKKSYEIDIEKTGLRIADVLIGVERGSSRDIVSSILEDYPENIIEYSYRIGSPQIDASVKVAFKESTDLFKLIQNIKKIENVLSVEWSEIIDAKKNRNVSYVDLIFGDRIDNQNKTF